MFLILAHFDCAPKVQMKIVCLQKHKQKQRVEKQSGKCIQNIKGKKGKLLEILLNEKFLSVSFYFFMQENKQITKFCLSNRINRTKLKIENFLKT